MFRLQGFRNHLRIGFVFLTISCFFLFNNVSAQEFSRDKIPPQFQTFLSPAFDIESLTPDQCKAIEAELSKRGGQAPPEAEEILNKCSSLRKEMVPAAGGKEGIQTGLEFIQEIHEEKVIQPLERFGLTFFKPARNRIIAVEDMISKGQKPVDRKSIV